MEYMKHNNSSKDVVEDSPACSFALHSSGLAPQSTSLFQAEKRPVTAPNRHTDPTSSLEQRVVFHRDWGGLNVGGQRFITTHETLRTEPGSLLDHISRLIDRSENAGLSPECAGATLSLDVDEEGYVLLDADPQNFTPILNYLRHGRFTAPPGADIAGIKILAEKLRLMELCRLLSPPHRLLAWGPSDAGEFGVGLPLQSSIPAAGAPGSSGIALYDPLQVPITRCERRVPVRSCSTVKQGRRVIQVALGLQFTGALTDAGEVFTFGEGHWGQLGLGPSITSVDRPQRVPLFGSETKDQKFVTHIACGYTCAMAVTKDHEVYFWGNNNHGQSALGHARLLEGQTKIFTPLLVTALSPVAGRHVAEVDCGSFFGVALTEEGEVYAWGVEDCLGLGEQALEELQAKETKEGHSRPSSVAVSLTRERRPVLLVPHKVQFPPSDGGVVYRIASLRAGQWHCCAINTIGEVFTWGVGFQGRLGLGNLEAACRPKRVEGGLRGRRVVSAACGSFHTAVITDDGSLFCWGDNSHRQCGTTTPTPITSPHRLEELNFVGGGEAVAVACGRRHTVVLIAGPHNSKRLEVDNINRFTCKKMHFDGWGADPPTQPFLIGGGEEFDGFAHVLRPIFPLGSGGSKRPGVALPSTASPSESMGGSAAVDTSPPSTLFSSRGLVHPIKAIAGFSEYNVLNVFTGHGPTFFLAEDLSTV